MIKLETIYNSFTILLLIFTTNIIAQEVKTQKKEKHEWFLNINYGVQMSGIKNEDFVPSNYSPVYRISIKKNFSKTLGAQIGYQGRYFRAITDDLRWTYDFIFIEGVLNFTNLVNKKNKETNYKLLFHAGPGYFYHHLYNRSDVHLNIGASNLYKIANNLELNLDLSAIAGWDIYQGDNDILPNLTLGLVYRFK